MIGRMHVKYRFYARMVFNAELLEICKFISPRDIFPVFAPVRLSIAVAKSENEFVAADLNCNMGFVHEPENLENRKFH